MVKVSQGVSVLLASAGYGGTLAAVRCLGKRGFGVNVISSRHSRPAAAAWSRFVRTSYAGPRETETERFVERLLAIGRAEPGQILLPTSDETAWIYTRYGTELREYFRLHQPAIETIRSLLDKKLFADAARRAGLVALPSWEPKMEEEVARLAPDLPYPILIKRRTHVHEDVNHKGVLVSSSKDLPLEFARFTRKHSMRGVREPVHEDSSIPFLQQFVRVEEEGVCSITGYVDRTGELFVTRRSVKVYQRSQPVGVGVCFESRVADPALSNAVRALCRELGYFGMFEVEFVRFEGSWAVIDFNPRLFNQVALDIHRGMPLPVFACLEALGDAVGLHQAVEAASVEPEDGKAVFCDAFTLHAILAARALTQRISKGESAYWRSWLIDNMGRVVDVARDDEDPLPGFIHALSEIRLGLQAIPKFLRLTPRVTRESTCRSVGLRL